MSGVTYSCKVKELLEDLEKEDELFTSPRLVDKLRTLNPEEEITISAESFGMAVVDIYRDEDWSQLNS